MEDAGDALPADRRTVNFAEAVTLIIESSPFTLELTSTVLAGFGFRHRCVCQGAQEAMTVLRERPIDLVLVNADLPGASGYDLVHWLRRSAHEANRFAPVIMTATHVVPSTLARARDSGASLILIKPFSPLGLLRRIIWAAHDTRPFLEAGAYRGPDRRLRRSAWPGPERRLTNAPLIARPAEPVVVLT